MVSMIAYNTFVKQGSGKDIVIFTSSQKKLSYQRKYYDSNFGIFPHLTAIIDVKNGVSTSTVKLKCCDFPTINSKLNHLKNNDRLLRA